MIWDIIIILNWLSSSMEKIDILMITFIIIVIIFSAYICYLKVGIKILFDIANNQADVIRAIMNVLENQKSLNDKQFKFNESINKHLGSNGQSPSPTGGRRSEAEA